MGVNFAICLIATCFVLAGAQRDYFGTPRVSPLPGPWSPRGPPTKIDCSKVGVIFCIANWCTVNTCPRFPQAVCRNLCNSPCLGAFYLGARQLSERDCQALN